MFDGVFVDLPTSNARKVSVALTDISSIVPELRMNFAGVYEEDNRCYVFDTRGQRINVATSRTEVLRLIKKARDEALRDYWKASHENKRRPR